MIKSDHYLIRMKSEIQISLKYGIFGNKFFGLLLETNEKFIELLNLYVISFD